MITTTLEAILLKNKKSRIIILTIWLILLSICVSFLFWHNEYKYSLPTPIPADYHAVKTGEHILINNKVIEKNNKPLLLHFFNPDCPCSRFNIPYVKSLIKQYGDKANFALVVLTDDKDYTVEKIQDKFNVKIPVLFDKSIATHCGVYSTPQAAILTPEGNLYYRGNYNKSRYCTDKETNYAQIALDSLLNNSTNPTIDKNAFTAYGCELISNCVKPK